MTYRNSYDGTFEDWMAEYDEINPAEVLNVELAACLSIHGSPFLLVEGGPVPAADITPRELLR